MTYCLAFSDCGQKAVRKADQNDIFKNNQG